jgi:peptide/nickel transport system substrate-binding protein
MKQSVTQSLSESIAVRLRRLRSDGPTEQLVYMTSPNRKVPSWRQLTYFSRLLTRSERLFALLAVFVIVIGVPVFAVRGYFNATEVVAQDGGTYTEGVVGSPQYINPVLSPLSDVDSDLTQLVFSSIFRYDGNQALQPDAITNYTISDDKKTYTFFLRHDVKWNDGQELTADDVLFTIGLIQDPLYQSPLLASLKGVTATKIDDHSFSLALKEPFAPFLTTLTFGILPKHIWFDVTPQTMTLNERNLTPVGSGMYAVESVKKDREGTIKSVDLERNNEYYGTKPHIEKFRFVFFADEASAIDGLQSHKVEGLAFFPGSDWAAIQKKNSALNLHRLRIPQYTAVFFNQQKSAPLQEGAVRKALAYALNKQQLVQNVFAGQAEVIHTPILPGYLGYNPGVGEYPQNTQESLKLLEEANWKYPEGKDATSEPFEPRQKNGKKLEFSLVTANIPEYEQTARELASAWKAIGVNVTITTASAQDIQGTTIKNRDYDALLFAQIIGTDPDPYPFWHSSQQEAPGLNLAIFRDREADSLLDAARKTTSDDERRDKYMQFQTRIAEGVPAIFLYNSTYSYAMHEKVRGVNPTQYISVPSDRFSAVAQWYIKSNRQFKSQ